jgi:hypothetical protein
MAPLTHPWVAEHAIRVCTRLLPGVVRRLEIRRTNGVRNPSQWQRVVGLARTVTERVMLADDAVVVTGTQTASP